MFLDGIQRKIEVDPSEFPWSLPIIRWLEALRFTAPVTFLVGENGSGKSTLLEGLAAGMDCVVAGGADMERDESLAVARKFAAGYRFSRRHKPRAKLFVRAEDLFGFVRRVGRSMDELKALESHFEANIKGEYGRQLARGVARGQHGALAERYGEDPDAKSHGETFLNLLEKRLIVEGLYFLDEPEAPLSPLRVLSLISLLKQVVADGSQLVIATHSPILMAFPGAEILVFDGDHLTPTPWDELDHVRLTRAFLNDPASYLRRL